MSEPCHYCQLQHHSLVTTMRIRLPNIFDAFRSCLIPIVHSITFPPLRFIAHIPTDNLYTKTHTRCPAIAQIADYCLTIAKITAPGPDWTGGKLLSFQGYCLTLTRLGWRQMLAVMLEHVMQCALRR
eukprot:g16830.t1